MEGLYEYEEYGNQLKCNKFKYNSMKIMNISYTGSTAFEKSIAQFLSR
jgi:hypothetical protein